MAFKMAGFSAFTKPDDKKEQVPQTTTRKSTSSDIMPQTERDKADIGELEGEILSIYDNEYSEAKDDNDTAAIKRYEKTMKKLRNEIIQRGGGELFNKDESHIDMSNF